MPMKKKACIVDIKKKFRKKYTLYIHITAMYLPLITVGGTNGLLGV
jgi:hypothetical protein